jgi:hypothetical protein
MSELLNFVGLGTRSEHAVLAMVVRASNSRPEPPDPLILAAAALGLAWNLCALPLYALPRVGIDGPPDADRRRIRSLGFPAVVVHSVLRGERTAAANASTDRGVSLPSAGSPRSSLHVGLVRRAVSVVGMRLLVYLRRVVPAGAITRVSRALVARSVAALAAFTVSALHLTELQARRLMAD